MYSHTADTARTIVGVIGNAISLALFISPSPTLWRVLKKKSVEEFEFHPYVASLMNCLLWVFYGLPFIHPHSILIITINGIGLLIELIYTAIYFIYTNKKKRLQILGFVALEIIIVAALGVISLKLFHTHDERSRFVGVFCVVFGIIMYGAPLTVMWKVIVTKSVEFMPFYLSLAAFLNGVCWTSYALIEFDLFVLIANGVGAVLGLAQLIMYAIYFSKGGKKQAHKTPEVQLSTKV